MTNHTDCRACSLWTRAKSIGVMGQGSRDGVLFVGIGPGDTEDAKGQPFVGRSGVRLRWLAQRHLGEVPYAVCNLVGCRPPNDKPTPDQIRVCWAAHVDAYLSEFAPRVVVLLGEMVASQILVAELGLFKKLPSIQSLKAKLFTWRDLPTLVTYHPAATLRAGRAGQNKFLPALEQAIKRARLIAIEGIAGTKPTLTDIPTVPWREDLKVTPMPIVMDVETTSLRPWLGKITHIGAAPCASPNQSCIAKSELGESIEIPPGPLVGWNFPFDAQWLDSSVFDREWIDGMVLHGMLYPDAPERSLKVVGPAYSGVYYEKTLKDGITGGDLDDYLRLDLYQTGTAVNRMLGELKGHPSEKYLFPFMMTLTRRLAQMQRWGMRIDLPLVRRYCEALKHKQETRIRRLEAIAGMAGVDLKVKPGKADKLRQYTFSYSKKQLETLLFEKLKYPILRTEKGNPRLDAEARLILEDHDSAGVLKVFGEYLTWQKMVQTDLVKFLAEPSDWIDADGFAHPCPQLVKREKEGDADGKGGGAGTGRIVWNDPNPQIWRAGLKPIVIPRYDGGRIAGVDLSQIEPRVLAWMSGDEILLDAFRTGKDFYKIIMSIGLGISVDEVSSTLRQVGKTAFLAILYGAEAPKIRDIFWLDGGLKISLAQANDLLKRFRAGLRGVVSWAEGIRDCVELGRPVVTASGRCRRFPVGDDEDVIRQAINFPVQSFASDVNHAVLLECFDMDGIIPIPPTIHDANTFDLESTADESQITDRYDSVQAIAKKWFGAELDVPVKYKMKIGRHWK